MALQLTRSSVSTAARTTRRALPMVVRRRSCVAVQARLSGGRGGNVLDRPDVDIKQSDLLNTDKDSSAGGDGPQTATERGSGGTSRQRNSPAGGGNYRVLLLNSPSHTEKGVVKAILSVVPGTDEAHARNCYATSVSLGMALVVSCLKEHAEHFSQQLYRYGCKTAIEPDSSAA